MSAKAPANASVLTLVAGLALAACTQAGDSTLTPTSVTASLSKSSSSRMVTSMVRSRPAITPAAWVATITVEG